MRISERKRLIRRRMFKRLSNRKLTMRDLIVLDFLWVWKVASSAMLKEVAFKDKSHWWTCKALRQLRQEKYIELLPRGKNIEIELWTLTAQGFEVVLMDRDDLAQHRYRVHAPAHDFLATCLQLGEFWLDERIQKSFFTEQMLASLSPMNFPKWWRMVPEHVPDGLTVLSGPLKEAIIGYEVDLNLKEEERYHHTVDYYSKAVEPTVVIWLVRNTWMAKRILAIIKERAPYAVGYDRDKEEEFIKKFLFFLVDDFKQKVWQAVTLNVAYEGWSLRKVHANVLQNLGKPAPNLGQKEVTGIFFPKFKSPQKSTGSENLDTLAKPKHPSGPGGNAA